MSSTVDRWTEWERVHQPFELSYHKEVGVRWCADDERFFNFWKPIGRFIKPKGRILDIGCGPRPPFRGTVIEPLAEEYMEITSPHYWDGVGVFARPAEMFIPHLRGSFDTVICWNVLDHTYNWKMVLRNIAKYAASDAVIAIATDLKPPSLGHPGFPPNEFWQEVRRLFRIKKKKFDFAERDVALVAEKRYI